MKPFWQTWISLEGIDDKHYSVYVVELSSEVLHEHKFVKRNPNYAGKKPCLYVGYTGLDPELRFLKHKDGIKANTYVQKYGLRLLPNLYRRYNPMFHDDAVLREKQLATDLVIKGFAVWQA